jgi:peptidoglycan hydrolase-like protein with peptidoglycan-binding domain
MTASPKSPQVALGGAADRPTQPTDPPGQMAESAPPSGVPASVVAKNANPPAGVAPTAPMGEPRLQPGAVAHPAHNPLVRQDAIWIQGRLRELGFYSANADGIWGPGSRAALRAFKAKNGLPLDDTWNSPTEVKLLDLAQARMDQTFEGDWAQHASDCGIGGRGAPLTISKTGATAQDGNCKFQDVRREDLGWRVQAICTGGRSSEANIRLSLVGGALTWGSERGAVTYFRCR